MHHAPRTVLSGFMNDPWSTQHHKKYGKIIPQFFIEGTWLYKN